MTPMHSQNLTRLLAVLFLIPAASLYARSTPQVCGTTPSSRQEALLTHAQSLRLAGKAANYRLSTAAKPALVADNGDLAILTDTDGVVSRRNLFNLDNKQIRFTPGNATATNYSVAVSTATFDSNAAAGPLASGIGDDDSRAFDLPFSFNFYGKTYRRIFLNSDGNLTFNSPDTATSDRSLGRLTSGPPRIAALFRDLDPTNSRDGIRVFTASDRIVFTWSQVPEFSDFGTGVTNTFQVRLLNTGVIELIYNGVFSIEAVVGISPGNTLGATRVVHFTDNPTGTFDATVAERFTQDDAVDLVSAAQKFFLNHDDAYDYLVVYNALNIPASSGAVAFELTVRSQADGIGDFFADEGPTYGSPRRLKAVINMGPTSQYPVDPNGTVSLRGPVGDTPLSIIAHETGHLWLAFVSVDPTNAPMLNQSNFVHWNFTYNSDASLLEGNRIADNGATANPRFTTTATVEHYSALDQYLMGFRPPADFTGSFYVSNANVFESLPRKGVSFNGTRNNVTIDALRAIYGPRVPDQTVSQRRFRFAFVVVTAQGQAVPASVIAQIDNYRKLFPAYFATATDNLAAAETTLRRNLDFSFEPAAGVLNNQTSTATLSVQQAPTADLVIALSSDSGKVTVPATVTIKAGTTSTTLPVTGKAPGVDLVRAVPADTAYLSTEARIQVPDSASSLKFRVNQGGGQFITSPGQSLPSTVRVALTDTNRVPYPGLPVTVQVVGGGSVLPSSNIVTNSRGEVEFTWTPTDALTNQLILSSPGIQSLAIGAYNKPFVQDGTAAVNAASFQAGLVPGSLATVFGVNLTPGLTLFATGGIPNNLQTTQVKINGNSVPLIFANETQINFLVPEDVIGTTAQLQIVTGAGTSNPAAVKVLQTQPGIFFDAPSGLGAVLIANTGLNTAARPAKVGDILEVYATGLGPLDPQGNVRTTPNVTLAGQKCDLLFAGLAPGFSGLYQINVRVPSGIGTGDLVLTLAQGTTVSNQVKVRVQ